jgi:hypothetical protein
MKYGFLLLGLVNLNALSIMFARSLGEAEAEAGAAFVFVCTKIADKRAIKKEKIKGQYSWRLASLWPPY